MPALPYWRLSGFYFFYFAFVGAMAPFWGLYLKSLAFSALQIGAHHTIGVRSRKDASTTESQGQIYLVDERFVKRMQTVMHHF